MTWEGHRALEYLGQAVRDLNTIDCAELSPHLMTDLVLAIGAIREALTATSSNVAQDVGYGRMP